MAADIDPTVHDMYRTTFVCAQCAKERTPKHYGVVCPSCGGQWRVEKQAIPAIELVEDRAVCPEAALKGLIDAAISRGAHPFDIEIVERFHANERVWKIRRLA